MKKNFFIAIIASFRFFGIYSQQFNQISTINPSPYPIFGLNNFCELNNKLIFTNSDNSWTKRLYISDGTMNGTYGIYSWGSPTHFIIPNETYTCNYDDEMKSFIKLGNQLYFKLRNNQNGLEFLWKTNGDSIGTILVKDLGTRKFCSNLIELNGGLFFMTTDFDPVWGNITKELWKTDGTQNGTVVINNWVNSSNFSNDVKIVKYYNKIYFSGFESDGSSGGTIQTGLVLPPENESCMYNGLIYYKGIDGKIWKSDGTLNGTFQAIDYPIVGNLSAFNGDLYFSGGYTGAGQPGIELCKTDGTLANTLMLKDIYVGFNSSNPGNFISLSNYLFFIASDGIHGNELWKTDGTSLGTLIVKDINISSSGFQNAFYSCSTGNYFTHQSIHNNELYFSISNPYWNGNQTGVWKTDGSELNTILVQPSDTVGLILDINCKLFAVLDTFRYDQFGNYFEDNSELWSLIDSCSSLGNNDNLDYNLFSTFPNPTSHTITIKGEKTMNQSFHIYDQMGREVFKGKLTGTDSEVNLSMLSKGIYTLKIEGNYKPAQIVKE